MPYRTIAWFPDVGSHAAIRALLQSEEIEVVDRPGGHVSIAGVEHSFPLCVEASRAAAATDLLRRHGFEKYLARNA